MRPHYPATALTRILAAALAALPVVLTGSAVAQDAHDHERGEHRARPHHPPHPRTLDPRRFLTSRDSSVDLPLPEEKDAFFFAVFGDRTGGPAEGVKVLAEAVDEVNLLEPDLVMTVGDLVEGYNTREPWMAQMREFKGIMDRLLMPWFPVAGNHDIYWRGPDQPPGEHEGDYEAHFGPLWYAFRHKDCWFIALYSDESDPDTGEKNFNKPECQRMSPEQFGWLQQTLEKTRGADHVFLFLHHPRWLKGRYGDDWDRVHGALAAAGNVSAVFAGHIHRMRYDGKRDGIEYFTLATVGGGQAGDIPGAGYLHQYHLVTVRKDRLAVSTVPVGAVFDPRAVTGRVSDECRKLRNELVATFEDEIAFDAEFGVDALFKVRLKNPVTRPIEVTITPTCADPRWGFAPDHQHSIVAPGDEVTITMRAQRLAEGLDSALGLPVLEVQPDYLGESLRVSLPARAFDLPLAEPALTAPERPVAEGVLSLDGRRDCVAIAHADLELGQGPFTLEGWLRADEFRSRQGFLNKTESCEYGFFVNDGTPEFDVHLGGRYVSARAPAAILKPGRWHHVAGVFDGAEVRLYVDGKLVDRAAGSGSRLIRDLPLMIGADVDRAGRGASHFPGAIDEVRLSRVARYAGEAFEPSRRHAPDPDTLLLLHMDGGVGPWLFDSSPRAIHPLRGSARVEVDARR